MKRSQLIVVLLGAVGVVSAGAYLATREEPPPTEDLKRVRIKRVDSGHKVTLKGGETLVYAGIRTPLADEPEHAAARQRNTELVEGQKVRVRYDVDKRDSKNRLIAYVSVDQDMVNEVLVREGLAYVRLTPTTRRFADQLLDAQSAARSAGLGVWEHVTTELEDLYPADPHYGNFHRPTCAEVVKIDVERIVDYASRDAAFDAGMAPCTRCTP